MPSPNLTAVLENFKTYLEAEIQRSGSTDVFQGQLVRDLQTVNELIDGIDGGGGGVSALEVQAAIEAAANLTTIINSLSSIYLAVDGIEPIIGNLSISSDSINLNTDTLEGAIATVGTKIDGVFSAVDGLEGLATTLNTTATGINTNIDGIETLLAGAATQTTLATRASEATLATRATETTLASLLAASSGANAGATQTTLATRASETTLATRASETTLGTRASETTLATRATETTLAALKDATVVSVPTITNLTLTSANTQYTHTFPAGTRRYAFKCRADAAKSDPVADVRYSWVTGMVATGVDSYDVLSSNSEEVSQDYFVSSKAIYFSSVTAGVVLSVRGWS